MIKRPFLLPLTFQWRPHRSVGAMIKRPFHLPLTEWKRQPMKAGAGIWDRFLGYVFGVFIQYLSFLALFMWIISGEVKTTAFLSLDGKASDEVSHIDHIAKLADILCRLYTLEELFGFFVKNVQTGPCSAQTEVRTHDAYIV